MKTDAVYKRAFNGMLEHLAKQSRGVTLSSENELSNMLNISRTTVRKILRELKIRKITAKDGKRHLLERLPKPSDGYSDTHELSTGKQVERQFMEWLLRGNAKAGQLINEMELARQFGVGTTRIREFLIHFAHYGMIEKRPNSGWILKGFTEEFALELFEVRSMFERRSAAMFVRLPASSPLWDALAKIKAEHIELQGKIETNYHDFSALDQRFHGLINSASPNRFIEEFSMNVALIFHYHYQWNKLDEKQRNIQAIKEHLAYIKALQSRDLVRAEKACSAHLRSARRTMILAIPLRQDDD